LLWRSPILGEGQVGLALQPRPGPMQGVNFRESDKGEVRRIPIPRTPVNRGERMSCWENTGRDEGPVLIMGTTKRRRQAGGRM
jgi:hypothetical protein